MKLQTLIGRNKNEDSTVRTDSVSIDAENAQLFLTDFNDSNRPISRSLVKLYANEFLRGVWKQNGENLIYGIAIGEDDIEVEHLISGQHRLLALIEAARVLEADPEAWEDADIVMHVELTRGVDMAHADSVDKGKVRSHTDVLFRSPLIDEWIPEEWNKNGSARNKWCKVLATAARVVWQREGGKTVSSAEKFVHSAMLTFLAERHPQLHEIVTMVLNAQAGSGGVNGIKASLAYVAGLGYMSCLNLDGDLDEDCTDRLEGFLDRLAPNSGHSSGDASHALAAYWGNLDEGSKDRDLDVVGPLVKCLNALMDGTKVTGAKLKLSKKERSNYKQQPMLLGGWDTTCAELVAGIKVAETEAKEAVAAEKEEAKAVRAAEREEAAKVKATETAAKKKADAKKKKASGSEAAAATPIKPTKKAAAKRKVVKAKPAKSVADAFETVAA